MDPRASVTLVITNAQVDTFFSTNLDLTFIRRSAAEVLERPIRPMFRPDHSFIDSATARMFYT
jgi:hypothetical protein